MRTDSIVPKYLVYLDYLKTSTAVTYTIHCYKGLNAVQNTTDAYGNAVKIYTGKFLTEDIPVLRTNYNYSLAGSTVWTPKDTTAENYVINEDVNEQVTMFATNAKWDNEQLGVTAGYNDLDALFTYPDFTDNMDALKVCYGVTYQNVTSSVGDTVAAVEGEWNSSGSKSSRIAGQTQAFRLMAVSKQEQDTKLSVHRKLTKTQWLMEKLQSEQHSVR